jgi:hypothetical protein
LTDTNNESYNYINIFLDGGSLDFGLVSLQQTAWWYLCSARAVSSQSSDEMTHPRAYGARRASATRHPRARARSLVRQLGDRRRHCCPTPGAESSSVPLAGLRRVHSRRRAPTRYAHLVSSLLLCETAPEPEPNLSYPAICIHICSEHKCIHAC